MGRAKKATDLSQRRVNFDLRHASPLENNRAVQVQGLGLELRAGLDLQPRRRLISVILSSE